MGLRATYFAAGLIVAAAGAGLAFEMPFLRDEAVSTASLQAAFSPGDGAAQLIIATIDTARHEILVQAFSFTHRDIAAALRRAHRRGVHVEIVADRRQTLKLQNSMVPELANAGIPVRLDAQHDSAHDKVMIVDAGKPGATLLTGSFNFTFAAHHKNSENVLAVRNEPAIIGAYADNWRRHQRHAQPFRPLGAIGSSTGETP